MINFKTEKTNKKSKFYITTAIDYTNAAPHIGHAYEKIVADVIARFHKLDGDDVFFLTGTDEHGQKVEGAAKKAGKSPQEFCDEVVEKFKKLCEVLKISNDRFIRTTEAEHIKKCQEIFKIVYNKGDIYKGEYEGLYCTGCERYYLEKELEDGNCPIHKRPVETIKEESYFFRMSQYHEMLFSHIKKNPEFIQPEIRRNEILSRLEEPLRDLSVSRTSFKWGIPLPIDEKHIIYVWFDALLNYLTGIDYPGEKYEKYWPADLHVIGKDIIWFHTVIWPCILIAAGIELPKTIFSHGFININGAKLSKSSGLVVDPFELVDKFGSDAVRYFFVKEIPFGGDGDFSEEAMIKRINAELADDLGNLVNRVSVLIHKNYNGIIPKQGKLEAKDNELIKPIDVIDEVKKHMNKYELNAAITKVWQAIKEVNKYITESEPWKIADEERKATVLYNAVEALRICTILITPFIPEAAQNIRNQYHFPEEDFSKLKFSGSLTGEIRDAGILFRKHEIILEKKPELILDLRVAKIIEVHDHPEADKLYVLKLDLGDEERQLVAGIRNFYERGELLDKNIIIVANLKHAKLRGIESEGMLLAAVKEVEGKDVAIKVLEAPGSELGSQVYFEGYEIKPKKEVDFKDFQKTKMTTIGKKVVHNGSILKTDKEEIIVDIEDGCFVS